MNQKHKQVREEIRERYGSIERYARKMGTRSQYIYRVIRNAFPFTGEVKAETIEKYLAPLGYEVTIEIKKKKEQ